VPPNTVLVPKLIYHALTCALCRCMDTDELCANTAAHQERDASREDKEGENDECDDDDDSEDTYFD